ncbi:hypothetical protein BJ166DRAFT_519570 [Pestalotiopsis sp. NC0098]|nr:hypothetical protein BJ166DRAFT_519570 [Pestalotiopsis sp. NC0098]
MSVDSINVNASEFYPYFVDTFYEGLIQPEVSYLPLPENPTISTIPWSFALLKFLNAAGSLTDNCDLAVSWYKQCDLGSPEEASFGSGNNSLNINFLRMAAPGLFINMTDSQIPIWYDLMANDTQPILEAVLSITIVPIEYYCLPKYILGDIDISTDDGDCATSLQTWAYPGLEAYDVYKSLVDTFEGLPDQYQNISIQAFMGWYGSQNASSEAQGTHIYVEKQKCFRATCASLNSSGNPDVAGVGMFISYILEAFIATIVVCQTGYHNWKSRNSIRSNATANVPQGGFVRVRDTFLENGAVFLLSLSVALIAVGAHETIIYNGLITELACYFTASAVLAVASVPHFGAKDNPTHWVVILACLLLLTFASTISGQYDVQAIRDTGFNEDADSYTWGAAFASIQANESYLQPYPILASSFFAEANNGVLTSPKPFTVSSCLLWSIFYSPPRPYLFNYLSGSFYIQEVVYLGGILLFFLLTKVSLLHAVLFHPDWIKKHERLGVFWLRSIFCFFAWTNMILGLICLAGCRSFEDEVMGTYDTEAAVGYGQVLSLFLWMPVFITAFQVVAKPASISCFRGISHLPLWHYRHKGQAYQRPPQTGIPLSNIPLHMSPSQNTSNLLPPTATNTPLLTPDPSVVLPPAITGSGTLASTPPDAFRRLNTR